MSSSTPIAQKRKSFADQPFDGRFKAMGDRAELKFERVCQWQGLKFARYGFNRPDLDHFETVPRTIRTTPDYLVEFGRKHYFVECKGSGYVVKLKKETIECMHFWNGILPVRYFVYNSVEDGYAFLSHDDIVDLIYDYGVEKRFESDNKLYYELPRSVFHFTKEKLNG